MSHWYRVFGAAEEQPPPQALLDRLHELGLTAPAQLRGDEDGWTALTAGSLEVECFLAAEPGIRAELNNWAAWLETCDTNPPPTALMERIIQTRQLYTLRGSDDAEGERVCIALCRHLAAATGGVYQADGAGLFAADGTLLVRED